MYIAIFIPDFFVHITLVVSGRIHLKKQKNKKNISMFSICRLFFSSCVWADSILFETVYKCRKKIKGPSILQLLYKNECFRLSRLFNDDNNKKWEKNKIIIVSMCYIKGTTNYSMNWKCRFLPRVMIRDPKSSTWWNGIDLAFYFSIDNSIVHA